MDNQDAAYSSFGNLNNANIENKIPWDEIINFIEDDSLNSVKMSS